MKRFTHMVVGVAVGMALGHVFSSVFHFCPVGPCDAVYLGGVLGAFFGVLPDADVIFHGAGPLRHRGVWSHSLLSSTVLSLLAGSGVFAVENMGVYNFEPAWWWSFFVGSVAFFASFFHTWADSLTRGGAYLLFPLSRRKFRGRWRYDSFIPNTGLVVAGALVIGFSLFLCKERLSLP